MCACVCVVWACGSTLPGPQASPRSQGGSHRRYVCLYPAPLAPGWALGLVFKAPPPSGQRCPAPGGMTMVVAWVSAQPLREKAIRAASMLAPAACWAPAQACAPPCPVSRGTRCTFSSAQVLNILSPDQRARCSPGATPGHHILQIRFYQQQQQGLVFVTETKWPAKSKTFITWPLKGKTWQQPCRAHPPSASRALTRLPCTARLCRRVSAHKTLQQRHSRSHGFTSAPALASRQRPGSLSQEPPRPPHLDRKEVVAPATWNHIRT